MTEYGGEHQTTEAHVPDPRHGHERSDVAVRPLVIVAVLLVLIAVFAHLALWGAMVSFERSEGRRDPPASPVADARPAPPEPRLQPTFGYHEAMPWTDLQNMRERDAAILAAPQPQWVDRQRGIVRIPIDQAMEMLLQQSQPSAEPATRPATTQEAQP